MTPALAAALDLHQPRTIALGQQVSEEDREAMRVLNRTRMSLTDDSIPRKVAAFRSLFGLSQHNNRTPGLIPAGRDLLHRTLIDEERDETFLASAQADLAGTIDGLLDLIYVAYGWALELGFSPEQLDVLMQEVHASNMTKVNGDGRPVYDTNGKVLKGEHYVRADIETLVAAMQLGQEPAVVEADPAQDGEG